MATAEQAVRILNKLSDELAKRQNDSGDSYTFGVDTLMKAYSGEHKLKFASDNFREYFADRYRSFSDNWCGIVADAPHERLEPIGIRLKGDESGDAALWDLWRDNDADALCDLALLDAIIAKRSYALVWGDEDDEPRITWESPSQAIVSYDPETRARAAGAKIWCDDEHEYATLYLPDEVWKFQRERVTSGLVDQNGRAFTTSLPGNWQPRAEGYLANPMGKVPLVELANRPRLVGEPTSDIAGVLSMQHAVNMFWAELFAVADEATLGQRLVIGAEAPMVPVLNAAGEVVGEKPLDLKKFRRDTIAFIGDPGAKAHQWDAAKLDVFTNVIEIMVGHIAAQTRTPAHYLLIGGTIANVSGDAMKALETGLVKRTEEKTQHFGRGIRDVFELVALAQGDAGKAAVIRGGQVLWKDIENRSDAQRADALSKKKEMGYPLRYLLEQDGLSPAEIERVMGMVRDEQSDPILSQILGKTAGEPAQAAAPDDAALGA
jgi:hypothetical protein